MKIVSGELRALKKLACKINMHKKVGKIRKVRVKWLKQRTRKLYIRKTSWYKNKSLVCKIKTRENKNEVTEWKLNGRYRKKE